MNNRTIDILIPTKNEAATISSTINSLPIRQLKAEFFNVRVILADSSTDNTARIAATWPCLSFVIPCPPLGKGYAVRKSIELLHPTYLFMLDGDGTYPGHYIVQMLQMLMCGRFDVVCGARTRICNGAMPFTNRIGNSMLTWLANSLYEIQIADLCTGLWGFKKKVLDIMKLTADGFDIEANIFTEINRNNLRLGHIAITYLPRQGKAKLRISDGIKIARRLISEKQVRVM